MAGYRALESSGGPQLNEAVARTAALHGSVILMQQRGELILTAASITVQLASLQSMDAMAHIPFESRDRFVAQQLDEKRYPEASFLIDKPVTVPQELARGHVASLNVPGQFSAHGVSRPCVASVTGVNRANELLLAGRATLT